MYEKSLSELNELVDTLLNNKVIFNKEIICYIDVGSSGVSNYLPQER